MTLRGHARSVSGLAYIGRGDHLATSSGTGRSSCGALRPDPRPPRSRPRGHSLIAVAATPHGRFVAGEVNPLRYWSGT